MRMKKSRKCIIETCSLSEERLELGEYFVAEHKSRIMLI